VSDVDGDEHSLVIDNSFVCNTTINVSWSKIEDSSKAIECWIDKMVVLSKYIV
jgi:hypothetical protein